MSKKLFSIVIPIYKAVENIPHTIPYIIDRIPTLFPNYDVELVMVCDGSPDNSWEMLKEYRDRYPEQVRLARFTRNYGQGMAINCGIEMARGDVIGVISQDLQDPFELFVEMLTAIEDGHDLVCAVREKRPERGFGALCSKLTHWLMHRFVSKQYPAGGCDFYAMTRDVAQRYILIFRKGTRILSMLEASASPLFIPYTRQKRVHGKSGYNLSKKINVFINLFVSSTYLPLRFMSVMGFFFAGVAFVFALVVFIAALLKQSLIPVHGWASTALLITFFSGLILASLGVIGEYLWRVFETVKAKPMYIVAETIDAGRREEREKETANV